ncbi:hypothetical protein NL453_29470, partial [Klebsiella pneumoniae]|nr:hypothetical protein [Klebsiella pneumoniae]
LITVEHGPGVETRDEWYCEAAWCGNFADGDFDQTERVFGSGGRLRGDGVTFVSAASTLDRLIWFSDDNRSLVSNSLP